MSSFIDRIKNPKTGKMQKALCVDDYYGNHKYGYGFRKDGKDATFSEDFKQCDFYRDNELTKL